MAELVGSNVEEEDHSCVAVDGCWIDTLKHPTAWDLLELLLCEPGNERVPRDLEQLGWTKIGSNL